MSVRRDVALGDATVLARRIRVYATAFATFLFAFCGVLFDLVEALYALEMRTQLVLETGVSRLCCALEHHAQAVLAGRRPGRLRAMDPTRADAQAKALAATRRILGVMRLEASGGEEASLTDQDRELLAGYDSERLAEDLRLFAEWHEALGTDPNEALAEMRRRLQG